MNRRTNWLNRTGGVQPTVTRVDDSKPLIPEKKSHEKKSPEKKSSPPEVSLAEVKRSKVDFAKLDYIHDFLDDLSSGKWKKNKNKKSV